MSDVMDAYWRTPPFSRNFATAVFAISLACYSGLLPMHWFVLDYYELFRLPPQLWRLVTSFLLSRPQISVLLDPYFVYSYMKQLEVGNPRFPRREDLVWYLTFVGLSIITLTTAYYGLPMGGSYLSALNIALAYTCTQDQRGQKANFYFITIPAQLVPYSMMLLDCIQAGPGILPFLASGLLSAHLYDFLSRLWPEFGGGRNLIQTPAFMSRIVAAPFQRVQERAYGLAFQGSGRTAGAGSGAGAGARAAASSSGGSGPLPDAWKTRGSGRRLGGD